MFLDLFHVILCEINCYHHVYSKYCHIISTTHFQTSWFKYSTSLLQINSWQPYNLVANLQQEMNYLAGPVVQTGQNQWLLVIFNSRGLMAWFIELPFYSLIKLLGCLPRIEPGCHTAWPTLVMRWQYIYSAKLLPATLWKMLQYPRCLYVAFFCFCIMNDKELSCKIPLNFEVRIKL